MTRLRHAGSALPRLMVALTTSSAAICTGVTWNSFASASAEIEIDYDDAAGSGFFDDTPRAPSADNPGTTLGEQRRLAFERAVAVWGAALQSDVPIVIEATFAPFPELPCEADSAVLGAARAEAAFAGFRGAPRPDLFYPSALADKLAGEDLDPGQPDITALFNPRLDEDDCLGALSWDYGLSSGGEAGLVSSVLHELGHGLGFASLIDEVSGEAGDGLSIFESLVLDRRTGLTWDVMSAAERQISATSPFDLVWVGERVTRAAPSVLAKGAPRIELSNGDVLAVIAEPSFDPFLGEAVMGELVFVQPRDACREDSRLDAKVVLLVADDECPDITLQISRSARRGAVAALTRSVVPGEPPWGIVADAPDVSLVSLALSQGDFDSLVETLTEADLTATLIPDEALLGTDPEGRVRLSATRPIQPGSSVSHWDASVRRGRSSPDDPIGLLMEPAVSGRLENEVSDLSVQLLQDLGWGAPVCGDGVVDGDEQCDEALDNSDAVPDACRSDCVAARCGDGVLDSDEDCETSSVACGSDCRSLPAVEPDAGPVPSGDDEPPTPGEPEVRDMDAGTTRSDANVAVTTTATDVESCRCRLHGGERSSALAWLGVTAFWLRRRLRGRGRRWPFDRS